MRSEGIDSFSLHSIYITPALVLRGVHTGCVSNWIFAEPLKPQLSQCFILVRASEWQMRNPRGQALSPGCNHCSAVTQTPGAGSLHINPAGFQQYCGDPPPSSFKYSFTELKPVIIRVKYDAMSMGEEVFGERDGSLCLQLSECRSKC